MLAVGMRCAAMQGNGGVGALTTLEAVCYLGTPSCHGAWLPDPTCLYHWQIGRVLQELGLRPAAFQHCPHGGPLDTTAPALRAAAVPPNVYIQYLQSALCGATPLLASRCLPRPIDPPPRSAQPPILEGLNLERLHDRVYLVAQPAPTPPE